MENASKALIMAAGILIGILILSLAAFLFIDFGSTSKKIYSEVELNQLTQYNAQYTVFSGREDITIYEIISLGNLAKQNNDEYKDYSNYNTKYKVNVIISRSIGIVGNVTTFTEEQKQSLIKSHSVVDSTGKLEDDMYFKCVDIEFYPDGGRVSSIKFERKS